MISSIAGNRPAVQQTEYSQKPPAASATHSDQDVQRDPALKTDVSASTSDKKTVGISESDLKVISELRQRDAEVRTHEAAHLAAAGSIATGGASFEYQQGPDGIQYAIGGEVSIDTSPVSGDPAATLRKADTIRRAALSPSQPSGPDMQVAASAMAMAAQAQAELLQKNQDTHNGNTDHLGTKINLSA
ncbi:MAG: putative metalloprotease CJM1_0395 family protein [Methylobacter sp.]|uniref:putative metalloprotease CJM1_0395 family protein n=1 Tax=Methylobacter sp. TaxID=2051955 RepID=UPI002731598C|nr:putative metalloprotease CJM1_0395 family protein [Methylobacter sp.]MDP1665613.1 putative metalloprotease CJM1_0395 family protein [Methylobacter sp.]